MIVRVAARGEGVSADGRHVAGAAPGDRLLGDGTVLPGEHRQEPPCRHFPECGGCQLQHLDDASYASFVRDRVVGALAGQGLEAKVRPAIVSPPRSRRRAALHAERRGRQVIMGFTESTSHRIVDMAECHILRPELFALVGPLRGLLAALLGERRADVHLTLAEQGVDVLIAGALGSKLPQVEALTAFAERHRLARLSIDDGYGPETRWEPVPTTVRFDDISVGLPPGAFLQATEDGEKTLLACVREAVGGASAIADLFAGLGTFSLPLASRAKVYAGEAAREPILALKAAAAQTGRPLFADHRDLYRRPLTVEELNRFQAVVLDPPRAGAREQAAALAASGVPIISFVSCNPSSFARDAKTMCEHGYQIDWVQPVGQFRWSTHVELVARLSR